ncbi:MAG TPA: EAL domain-containing protein [Gemmatimonadales bacterium]|nr:EAL domain-containing protein [Gemmatimonadales bacterium]
MLDVLLLVAFSGGVVYLVMQLRSRRQTRRLAQSIHSETRFRGLTELSADWFWETDAEHRVVWLSGGAPVATFFGQTPTYGKRLWEIPGVEVEAAALRAHLERLEARQPFFDLEIARSDGRGARQMHIVSGQSRLDAEGAFLGYRGVGRDVTEQRSAERALWRAKQRLELALDGGNLAEFHFDAERGELSAGDGWVRFLGHESSPTVTLGAELIDMMHPDDRLNYTEALVRALKGEAPVFETEFRIRTRQGRWKWLQARGRVTEHGAEGRATRVSGTVADIDERKLAEAALAEREQRFRDVVDASGEYVWETDAEWRYTYLSERAEAVLGYPRAELLGRRPRDFMPLGEPRAVDEWLAVRAFEGEPFRDLLHRMITKSGGVIWQSVNAVPVRDAEGRLAGWRGTGADVTARKHAEARIEHLATRDSLTALPNSTLLADRASQAILTAARNRSQFALLCIDLDRFKLVNDSLGHRAGDALLRAVAERLGNLVHGDDTLARLGGDDFVLLQAIKTVEDAAALAQRILGVLARPFTVEGKPLNVAASIGISIYPNDGRDFVELLKNADAALYHAKESGKGTWRLFAPALNARAAERLRLENELRSALARGELVLHWQPVVRGWPPDAAASRLHWRGRVVGAEALVRWQHPERGLLAPEHFVPLAEECGLIRAVDDWVLERALSQAGAWQRRYGKLWYAVNVSAPELSQGNAYAEKLKASLRENQLDGRQVELEVTERVLMTGLAENVATLKAIGELGVRFAIDDFGTGYSSLAYLRQLPIDKLKIDRSFLQTIDSQAADEAIVRAITALAATLGISVAAEGVETAAQLERLLALGCEEWQGHYFSAPLDTAAFEALLSASFSERTARSSEA